jgi:hypothetical protein
MVAMLLLALWVPAMSHCLLESAGIIESDECCAPFGASPVSDSHDCGGPCQTVESIGFSLPQNQSVVAPPGVVFLPLTILGLVTDLQPAHVCQPAPNPSPPERLTTWQFATRTASPVRAPSRIA